jgi:hypothetical protein
MKKIICFILIFAFAASLCSCGKTKIDLEGTVMTFDHSVRVIDVEACSSANASRYPNAKVVDYTLKAENGNLIFVGSEGEQVGTYEEYERRRDEVIYRVVIGDKDGYASLSEKEYEDGVKRYVLLFTLKGHTITFVSDKTAE